MLSSLHIENIALIEAADLSFGSGLNVLTGETGAGKSIILDAISALMGERTSRDLIRTGEKTARVSGIFCDLPALPWFEEMGIAPDENGELSILRELRAEGKTLCRVGGIPCTALQLRALGQQLVNIHGQHDSQALLDPDSHLRYLDSFGGHEGLLSDYSEAYGKLQNIRREMERLSMNEAEKSRRVDSLQYQIKELERASLRPGEEESLQERREVLRNSEKLQDAVERAYHALSGDEDCDGAVSLLMDGERALSNVSHISAELGEVAERLADLQCLADDLASQIRGLRDSFDASPGELDEMEGRLDLLYRLKKKYGSTVEEMLSYLEACRQELEQIEMAGDTLLRLEKDCEKAKEEALERAKTLSKARTRAGARLREKVESELIDLDMPKVRFQVLQKPREGGNPLSETGMDEVSFLMSANVGEALKPIQKVASGGELSRIMLALTNVLVENDSVGTLIFDEVDAGVSGRAAQKVAEKLGVLGRRRQILSVTHLAQIAAMADLHFSVEKEEKGGRTHTRVLPLDQEARVLELSRLTGGAHVSEAIRQGARELLEAAEAVKNCG